MSEIPMEYKVMKKKFFKSVQSAIKEDLVGILVYGGAASERLFSGVSDIDFFIILKSVSKLSKPLSDVYQALSKEIMQYFEDPLFSSILDYEIYVEDQLPTSDFYKGFSPIKIISLSKGEVLVGENPFKDLTMSDDDIKGGAHKMVQDYLEKLTSLLFMPSFDLDPESGEVMDPENLDAEKEFLAVDAVLSSAQAYHMVKTKAYVNMPDVVLFSETEPIKEFDNELIQQAGLLKQGVDVKIDNFYNRSIDFCATVIKLL